MLTMDDGNFHHCSSVVQLQMMEIYAMINGLILLIIWCFFFFCYCFHLPITLKWFDIVSIDTLMFESFRIIFYHNLQIFYLLMVLPKFSLGYLNLNFYLKTKCNWFISRIVFRDKIFISCRFSLNLHTWKLLIVKG